ncbi:MAG: UDP-2,4-diacetamido-2,4,6-trideoxy-beta-L-altropyranose hydrolase [Spirulina sp. SIO3F2]|nr:UDP-2,4-diacetamido-2,4,6-trideoxy-beta-L-altropyranose hydrolase [Spirulina sp. SIO3F2]
MKLLIRVDGSIKIGSGHVMRCLAIAQAWQDSQGKPMFVMAHPASPLEERLKLEDMAVIHLAAEPGSLADAQETAALAAQYEASWVVVDGYQFGSDYQKAIKAFGLRLLFIDDYGHADHYYADIVLNQNISADEQWYQHREANTQLLLGARYALLRREFWQWRDWQRTVSPIAKKVLVTLGGSDPDNVTLKVIQALQLVEQEELEIVVVVGGSNPHYASLDIAAQDSRFPICLERNVTNMPELMVWADVAISAGGSTCWELAFMGLPSLLIIIAENQRTIVEQLAALKCAMNLGWHDLLNVDSLTSSVQSLSLTQSARFAMKALLQQAVDGLGSDRVVTHLLECSSPLAAQTNPPLKVQQ